MFALYCLLWLRWCIGAPFVVSVRCGVFLVRCAWCFVLSPCCFPSRYALTLEFFARVGFSGVRVCSRLGAWLSCALWVKFKALTVAAAVPLSLGASSRAVPRSVIRSG